MNKEIILQQKAEKDGLLTRRYIERSGLEQAKKYLNSDLAKIIIGPRRAGKSVFALMLLDGADFAYLNFDDENLLMIQNKDEIISGLHEVYGGVKTLLFDEIQNLPKWEIFVNQLLRRGYNVILTGSNANLLSKEMATSLTGRYVQLDVLPFNFEEFLKANQLGFSVKNRDEIELPQHKGALMHLLETYLTRGGFPELAVYKELEPKGYLDTLFDAILLKDVVKRYKVRFTSKIIDLGIYLANNFSSEFTFSKLRKSLNFGSVSTLQNYVKYLEEAYLVFVLNRFSYKVKEQINASKKIYLVDNGFITAKGIPSSENRGRLMENLVFSELLKQGHIPNRDLFYYKTRNNKEIDFVVKVRNKIRVLIQSCYTVKDENAVEREISALLEASEELACDYLIVINWDQSGSKKVKGKDIIFVPLWSWLLRIYQIEE